MLHASSGSKNWTSVVVSLFWNLMMTSLVRKKKKAKQVTTAKTLTNLTKTFMFGIFDQNFQNLIIFEEC